MINEPDLFQNEMSAVKNLMFFVNAARELIGSVHSSSLHGVPSYSHPVKD